MPTYINETTGEILDFITNEDYRFIKSIESIITQGKYVKIPTQEFILEDMGSVDEVVNYQNPQFYGYQSNNTMIELDITYEV